MKQLTSIIHAVLVLILAWLVVSPRLGQASQPEAALAAASTAQGVQAETSCATGRTVQVSGTAVVNVIPDRALIQLGVQSNGATPQRVEAANSETINRIVRVLEGLGIEAKDIVTDWYVIQPVYDSYGALEIKGYRIDNVVAVTLRAIGKANQAIIAALEAGANQVINVEFYLSDLRTYRDQARLLAVEAAQEKAQDLAAATGEAVGCVLSINENTWSYYNGGWYGQSRELWTQNVVQNVAPAGGELGALSDGGPVKLGQIAVRAEVSASFSLK